MPDPREWLRDLPEVRARLLAEPPARVADVGCGAGRAAIALARAFPRVRVAGFDGDDGSIAEARRHASEADVADRVTFEVAGTDELPASGDCDLVWAVDLLAGRDGPVETLRALRALCAPGGAVLVAERRWRDGNEPQADEVRHAGFTTLTRLPVDDDGRYGWFRLTP